MNSKDTERRRSPRIDKCGDYLIKPGTFDHEPCVLKNISVTGACIMSESGLAMDQMVELHVCRNRDLMLKSQVVWVNGNEYGLSFMLDTAESFNVISFIMNNEHNH